MSNIYPDIFAVQFLPRVTLGILSSLISVWCRRSHVPKTDLQATEEFQDVLVLPADKGNMTVLMDREEYHQKITIMLNDKSTYKKRDADPTLSLQRKSNLIVKLMFDRGYIDFSIKKYLTKYNSVAPKIYGLPKIHKDNGSTSPSCFLYRITYVRSIQLHC